MPDFFMIKNAVYSDYTFIFEKITAIIIDLSS